MTPGSPVGLSVRCLGRNTVAAGGRPCSFSSSAPGRGGSPVGWFIAHIVCRQYRLSASLRSIQPESSTGPPALLLLNLLALMAIGIWARVRASRAMADTFGTKLGAFAAPDGGIHAALRDVIKRKVALLTRLDPAAHEATFSVTLSHLLRRPGVAIAYMQLAVANSG